MTCLAWKTTMFLPCVDVLKHAHYTIYNIYANVTIKIHDTTHKYICLYI